MGGKSSQSQNVITIPPEVLARYNSVNATAEKAAANPFQQYSTDPAAFVAQMNGTQTGGVNSISNAAGVYKPYYENATSGLAAGQDFAHSALQGGLGAANAQQYGALSGIQSAQAQGQGYLNNSTALAGGAYNNAQGYNNAATGYAVQGGQAVDPTAIGGAQIGQFMDPYLNSVVGSTVANLRQQQGEDQSTVLGNQIAAGAFGGDRGRIAQANLAKQQEMGTAQTVSGLLSQGYGQALGAAQQQQGVYLGAGQANRAATQATGQQLAGLGNQSFNQGLSTAQQYAANGSQGFNQGLAAANAQAGIGDALFNQGATIAGKEFDMANTVANQQYNMGNTTQANDIAQGQAQLTAGKTQQDTEQAGKTALFNQFQQQQAYPFQTAQFLANVAEGTGSLSGNTTTSTQPNSFFSDERLKEDMETIGKTFDGQKIVKFRYKGSPIKQIGLVAQDVEKHHPDAVGLARGFKTVDYDKATNAAAEKGHYARGGLVPMTAKRYAGGGYADGGLLPYGGDSYERTGGGPRGAGLAPPSRYQLQTPAAMPKLGASGLHEMASTANDVSSLVDEGANVYDFFNKDKDDKKEKNRGGLVRGGYATGGLPYSDDGYVPDNDDNKTAGLKTAGDMQAQQSGLGKAASTAKDIGSIIKTGAKIASFFNRGGLVPRHGYATDGAVDPDAEADLQAQIAAEPPPELGPDTQVPARKEPAEAIFPPDNMPREEHYAPPSDVPAHEPDKKNGNWFDRNRSWLLPVLKGVGTTAASPSRFALGAILQGVGAGAGAYGDMEKQQAGIAQTKAETARANVGTQGAEIDNFYKSIYSTPFGRMVFLHDGTPIMLSEYEALAKAGKAPLTLGRLPSDADKRIAAKAPGTPSNALPASGTQQEPPAQQQIPAQQQPAAPPLPAPATLPSGVRYDDKSREIAKSEKNVGIDSGIEYEQAAKTSDAYRNATFGEAQAARQNSPYLKELATTLADAYSNKGLATPGYSNQFRAELVRMANTISRSMGNEVDISDADKDADVVNKITTLMGQQGAQTGGQESYRALELIKNAIPNLNMSPDAGADLAATLMMMNRRAIDRDEHYNAYRHDSGGLTSQAANDFSRTNPDGNYAKEQSVIADLIRNDPEGVKQLMSGKYSAKAMIKQLRSAYGPGVPAESIVRYFSPRA